MRNSHPKNYTVTSGEDCEGKVLSVTVTSMVRRDELTVFGPAVGLRVSLEIAAAGTGEPVTYFLSRLEGERVWAIDAKFGPDGYPYYVHAFGERLSAVRSVIKAVAHILDDLARFQGLVENIGEQVPLVLAAHPPSSANTKPGASE
ncbi:hypothetical protein OG304_06920 [Streptomyces sp. NBC_00160]|uniref:hypothetical protein n=1 Tax=Streptomyces sp. NBC_00160 TaxID=2903628 RepID=UPI00225613E6|nr:hypothetical protein [Streptomyces sp. NBC_00160]MCX5303185.1 hypothetical protein [Streptomyces sp. NBC_00160]